MLATMMFCPPGRGAVVCRLAVEALFVNNPVLSTQLIVMLKELRSMAEPGSL